MADSDSPDPENTWVMLRTAVNDVMLDTLAKVGEGDREKIKVLRDMVGQKMAAEVMRVHPKPGDLLAEMIEAGAIRIDFDAQG